MKKLLCVILFASVLANCFGQVARSMFRLPDTGQMGNFTPVFGEDSDYNIYAPYFVSNRTGTVTDTITFLMWQQTDGGEMTLENATIYCDTLSVGGFTDWRLPSAQEAFSILNHGRSNPALDITVFPVSGAEYWWTSDYQANDASKVWVTNAGGGIGNHPKTETISAGGTKKFHVRAVRDLKTPPMVATRFIPNNDSTIIDQLTDLVWQQFAVGDSMTWEEALDFAENLVLGGVNDWRLPNIKELHSLNDEQRVNPSIDPGFFPGIGVKKYWSSTSLPNQPSRAWYLDTRFGITTYELKSRQLQLLCVRNRDQTSAVTVENAWSAPRMVAYPNPFGAHLFLSSSDGSEQCALFNTFGNLVFSGTDIANHDFSHLPQGIYYLYFIGKPGQCISLLKG